MLMARAPVTDFLINALRELFSCICMMQFKHYQHKTIGLKKLKINNCYYFNLKKVMLNLFQHPTSMVYIMLNILWGAEINSA